MTTRDFVELTSPTTLEIVRLLPGPITRVWEHLTVSHLRSKWFCAGDVQPQKGGEIAFEFDHRRLSDSEAPHSHKDQQCVSFTGEVLIYEPPHTLSFLWPEDAGATSQVTITLRETDQGVELHLVHIRLTNPDSHKSISAGWHTHLDLLSDVLEGRERRDFWLLYQPLETHYEQTFSAN